MVTLPRLDSYSDNEIKAAQSRSPACSLYFEIIQKVPKNDSERLRQKKHEQWLQCAMASLFNKASAETICQQWSQDTDKILDQALKLCQLDKAPVAAMALGKLGSNELNLSSDIDLVFIRENGTESQGLLSSLRQFLKLLNENNAFGFCYRVDLNLRPGGDSSPLLPTQSHHSNFYDEYLESWHRMSFIRMRPLSGPESLCKEIMAYCHRHSFPKRLDFAVINEIKNIRSKLNYQWRRANEPLDIKFSPGGIRDIELYVHSLQVIYGGRKPELQVSSFSQALKELHQQSIIRSDDYNFLHNFYWNLRDIENLIQIHEDKHTYLLRPDVLRKMEYPLDEKEFSEKLKQANQLIEGFFVKDNLSSPKKMSLDRLSPGAKKSVQKILDLKSHTLIKAENEKLKHQIVGEYLDQVRKISIDQDLAIQIFSDFIFSIRAKSSIFHLLARHTELLENLAWLFSVSPFMGRLICRRPELLDSFSLGSVSFPADDDLEDLLENLHDYKLLGSLVSVTYLLKNQDIHSYGRSLSERADFIVLKLVNYLQKQLNCAPVDLLCMGKWGGLELGIQSDLDLVLLSDDKPTTEQVQLARKLINLLSLPHKAGKLYSIDLRLKPEETAVPLLINKKNLNDFLRNNADPWQKQAYLRARMVGQDKIYLKEKMELLWINKQEKDQLEEVHQKLISPPTPGVINLKNVTGGIIHTEFTVQKHFLYRQRQSSTANTYDLIDRLDLEDGERLKQNYSYLRRFEQIFQICNDSPSTKVIEGSPTVSRMAKILRQQSPYHSLQAVLVEQSQILKKLDLSC
jgi:[glutamine synthetase] adenylyltransferase / [glutamine synthetase]-adenylyl-L-tyrosine phosphorylase